MLRKKQDTTKSNEKTERKITKFVMDFRAVVVVHEDTVCLQIQW